MKRYRVVIFLVVLLISSISLAAEKDELRIKIDVFQRLLGLKENVFGTKPGEQLGSVLVYSAKKDLKNFSEMFGLEIKGRYLIQFSGRLVINFGKFLERKTRYTFRLEDEVLFIWGDFAVELVKCINDAFTIDKQRLLAGREIIIFTGSEARTILEFLKTRWEGYFGKDNTDRGLKEIGAVAYEDAQAWVKSLLLSLIPWNNTGAVIYNPVYLNELVGEGLKKISLNTGSISLWLFNDLGKFLSYLAGFGINAGETPESILLRRAGKLVGNFSYSGFYTLANILENSKYLLLHPLVSFNLVSETFHDLTFTVDTLRQESTVLISGFMVDNFASLGDFVNFFGENPIGNCLIFSGRKLGKIVELPADLIGIAFRGAGNTLMAIFGFLSPVQPRGGKLVEKDAKEKIEAFLKTKEDVVYDLAKFQRDLLRLLGGYSEE